jgi:hypothetical protein
MYASCLFCTRPLGRNETVEEFPVGRRLAFDGAKGRLWVVCPQCGRWNLSPLEERWEAIEACERAYRGTRLRASTENIGLARVGDGLELVRVGRPLRPELAAWRYGSTFAQRHRKHLIGLVAGGVLTVPIWATSILLWPVVAAPAASLFVSVPDWLSSFRRSGRLAAALPCDAEVGRVRRRDLGTARITRRHGEDDAPWTLRLDVERGILRLKGADARHAAGALLAYLNRTGARARLVQQAVARLEAADPVDTADALFVKAARTLPTPQARRYARENGGPTRLLQDIPRDERLALEMIAHEDAERRALEGELAELQRRWQQAEQIAAIADDLLLPQPVHAFLERQRAGRRRGTGQAQ